MKILSIEFEKHPILGNLRLNFADRYGNPVDTIILAGENGCGKTTILEELQNLWTGNRNANYKGRYITVRIYLDEIEMEQITQKITAANHRNLSLVNSTGYFEIRDDLSTGAWGCYSVKCKKTDETWVSLDCVFMVYLQPFAKSIFSPVDINYRSPDITSVQSSSLDSDNNTKKKSDINLAQNINQMLVDIDTLDSQSLKRWTMSHRGSVPPDDVISPRIDRFAKAFSIMFNDLSYNRVDNINNSKVIFFRRNNSDIPISQLSSGEKQIVYRGAFFLRDIKLDIGKMILIDEPEISLHPEWQKKILNYYQQLFTDEMGIQRSQMFVATHSPFIIHNPDRHNDKVVVLQKDDKGNIYQSDKPEYYDCNSCKVIEDSFSVYDFKNEKNKILFAEDKYIQTYKIAWLKLNDIDCNKDTFRQKFDENAPFCIYPAEGASNLSGFLRCQNIEYFNDKKIVGLFDFDEEGVMQFNNCKNETAWKNCPREGTESSGIYKRRKGHNCFVAMLLPVPSEFVELNKFNYISNFVTQEHLLPKSFLVANNFIEEYTLPIPNGPTVYKARDDKKSEIWKRTFDLTKNDFANFKVLFDTLDYIWNPTKN